jgi:hypothetical protein
VFSYKNSLQYEILKYGRNAMYRKKNMMKCERMLFLDSCVSRCLDKYKRLFGKILNFFLFKINNILVFLYRFDVLILKIIFKK